MKYPTKAKVDDVIYDINTDFRYAIKCQQIAEDKTIGDTERCLGIIYTLFGDKGINNTEHYEKLLELAKKYLSCGKGLQDKDIKPDMDYIKDYSYIKTSFRTDYHGMDIDKEQIHWWEFVDMLNGLSDSEMGNCCILNKIRNGRRYDASKIEDPKKRKEFIEWQNSISLEKQEKDYTQEELENMNQFYEQINS